jgi:hypothetical protein
MEFGSQDEDAFRQNFIAFIFTKERFLGMKVVDIFTLIIICIHVTSCMRLPLQENAAGQLHSTFPHAQTPLSHHQGYAQS